jgi:hypothetical protein
MNFAVFTVYLGYFWVSTIHSIFTGATAYAFWGNTLKKWPRWSQLLLLGSFLAFLEIYWMPTARFWQAKMTIGNPEIKQFFGFSGDENAIDLLHFSWFTGVMWVAQAWFSWWIGQKILRRLRD